MQLEAGTSPLAQRAIILLDGVRQYACERADDERGFVDVLVQPLELRYSAPGTLLKHRLFGQVRIIDPNDIQTLTDVYSK